MAVQRLLVTGASGFVGRHLVPLLRARFPQADVRTPHFDVTDAAQTQAAVQQNRPDVCVHLAAVAAIGVARQDPDLAWRVNLHGSLNLARALKAQAPDAALLFVGSADAYGQSFKPGHPLDEAAPLAPMNTYGATKAAADLALGAMVGEGLRVIRARSFNHTGVGQTPDFVVPAFARQIARIKAGLQPAVMRVGNLDSQRDFLDVRDVCQGYADLVQHADSLPAGCIVNIASGAPRRIADILTQLLDLAGVKAQVETEAARQRATDIPLALGDSSQMRDLTGWQPRVEWAQTLRDVLDDWQVRVTQDD